MRLTDILSPERIRTDLVVPDKSAAIAAMVDILAETGGIRDRDDVLRAVLDRESTRSTGIGNGLAVPHGKCRGCPGLVMAFAKLLHPIDFESIDGKPVDLVVLLASPPDQAGPHIQALAQFSRLMLMEDFRRRIEGADSPRGVYEVIADFDRSNPASF